MSALGTAWHTGLMGDTSWTLIGALSRRTRERGVVADERRAHCIQAYSMRHVDSLLERLAA